MDVIKAIAGRLVILILIPQFTNLHYDGCQTFNFTQVLLGLKKPENLKALITGRGLGPLEIERLTIQHPVGATEFNLEKEILATLADVSSCRDSSG